MAPPETSVRDYVGRALERVEDETLLRGQGWYIGDLDPLPQTGHAAVLRSPLAHARIVSVDASQALAARGVIGVVTGADVARLSLPFPSALGGAAPSFHACAIETVRYVGEPVCVVVATDRYLAEDALELVRVEYDPLPVVSELAAAPVVHERRFRYGDADSAFARADVVVRERFRHPRSSATPIECYGVIASWEQATGSVTAWANFQGPFTLHGVAAAALGIPGARLRLCTPADSGGSYGIKSGVYVAIVLMAVCSRALGVPVRWDEDRIEHMLASQHATERESEIEAAFARDGALLGLRFDLLDDVGAYVRAPEPATLYRMHACITGAYDVQDVDVRSRVAITNRCPTGLNRGFGGPQLYGALERTMAIAATRLGLDTVELARRNLVRADQMPFRAAAGAVYDSGDYGRCLDALLELAGYDELRAEQASARADGRLMGIGLACVVEPSVSNMGYISLAQTAEERAAGLPKSGNSEGVSIAIGPHGGITVRFTSTPQGQGHRTVAAQVVADALGVEPGTVDVRTDADTAANPWTVSSGNYSSRFAAVVASAVHVAATQLADRLRALAAPLLQVEVGQVELRDGAAHAGSASISLRRLVGAAHWDAAGVGGDGLALTCTYTVPIASAGDDDRINGSAAYGFIADLAVVDVDARTGVVRVRSYATVHDAGRILNPLIAEGQVLGGLAHGIGAALLEEHRYDADGNLQTASFVDYTPPTATELPPVRSQQIETPSPVTPLGAKGIGEGNTMSAPAAIGNAVADALQIDQVELPLTPDRVWRAMRR